MSKLLPDSHTVYKSRFALQPISTYRPTLLTKNQQFIVSHFANQPECSQQCLTAIPVLIFIVISPSGIQVSNNLYFGHSCSIFVISHLAHPHAPIIFFWYGEAVPVSKGLSDNLSCTSSLRLWGGVGTFATHFLPQSQRNHIVSSLAQTDSFACLILGAITLLGTVLQIAVSGCSYAQPMARLDVLAYTFTHWIYVYVYMRRCSQ